MGQATPHFNAIDVGLLDTAAQALHAHAEADRRLEHGEVADDAFATWREACRQLAATPAHTPAGIVAKARVIVETWHGCPMQPGDGGLLDSLLQDVVRTA